MTVSEALRHAGEYLQAASESPRLDGEVLLGHVCDRGRSWLYANPECTLSAEKTAAYLALVRQRKQGKPVAHLTGEREFWSLPIEVSEHTLVPRPETELLVETALTFFPASASLRILDLGTGSGAIAIAIATERGSCAITATDKSAAALDTAMRNAGRICPGRVTFYEGDWFDALPAGTPLFDIIISNPPYIAITETGLTDPELQWEPDLALYSGPEGLDAIERIIDSAGAWLSPGGRLLLEHGFRQQSAVAELLRDNGFDSIEYACDLAGNPRVTHARTHNHD